MSVNAATRAELLVEALPYIRQFRAKVVVVKFGGNALAGSPAEADRLAADFAADVVLMHSVGLRPVVVHGGGPQIGELMQRLGKEPEFRNGLRVTDAETLDIARMVLVGKINRDLVGALNTHGPLAVGLSGEDAGLIHAAAADPALGFVGDVEGVNPLILQRLLAEELIPVVATIGSSPDGQAYNINADTVAAALAAALGAERLVYLSDIPGLLNDVADPTSLISKVTAAQLSAMIEDGRVAGGMIPKIQGCIHAVTNGVGAAHILDGRLAHAALLEFFTREGIGTMVTSA